ncbi:hypothetical protein SRB5_06310 [Streptomyces sp. RB5]|uniref:HTH tetR-type domain-containing protein n=1 Tax=Streptomyces smaragdinus TaxID=2585196 RepID=A0A7K0CAW1_9ACTN|nr:TetR/AcrR family transcriptional regulator [Streptomyces smaragdinus]MQY10523.1 hypothetical protein [Streptomyces smaragdinus]
MREPSGTRTGYHHGDLENALVAAATELAREGGPEAVVLREAARRVGVSPTAAYRHFANQADLLHAVKAKGQRRLARTMAGLAEGLGAQGGPRERFYRLGQGYVRFAVEEPGLYRTAFCHVSVAPLQGSREGGGDMSSAFDLLVGVLDELESAGVLRPGLREGAEFAAWSAVHGLAMLILDGSLAVLPEPALEQAIDRTLRMVITGLTVD